MKCFRSFVLFSLVMTLYGVRRLLDEAEVAQAVALLEKRAILRAIAERLDVSRSVVAGRWRRYQETGEFTTLYDKGKVVNA